MDSVRRIEPGPGQESVWDYPRPPAVEPTSHRIEVELEGVVIADSTSAHRVLETSHPPVYYVPRSDIRVEHLIPSPRRTVCEYKGEAHYYDVVVGERVERNAAWTYPDPNPGYEQIADEIAFYPARMDECRVDGEVATAQPGSFYGGWITSRIVGPFKGAPGTVGW